MPFTISHAAAALPLRRLAAGRLPFAALVVGTLSPDFEYPLRLAAVGRVGHTASGLITFCVPVGLLALAFARARLWPWLAFLAPSGHRERLEALEWPAPAPVAITVLALALGAASHVAWDSFTHKTGWVVTQLPALQRRAVFTRGLGLHVYQLLQFASSLFGLAVLGRSYARWYQSAPLAAPAPLDAREARLARGVWLLLAVAPVVCGLAFAARYAPDLVRGRSFAMATVQLAEGWIVGLWACLLALGLVPLPVRADAAV